MKNELETIRENAEKLVERAKLIFDEICSLKPVGHMTQEELDDKELIERAQAASRGIVDSTYFIERVLKYFEDKNEK